MGINYRQLQDHQKAHVNSDNTSEEEVGNIPSFNPIVKLKETPHTHRYTTWSKGQPPTLVQSTIPGMGMDHSDGLSSCTQHVDHCPAYVNIDSKSL